MRITAGSENGLKNHSEVPFKFTIFLQIWIFFIFPETSNYKSFDFDFRLSSATVELESSSFTPLPSVSRKLMILDGEIEITHEKHYSKKLNKFDTDEFEGDWGTTSVGKCVDFNLMTRGNTQSDISSLILSKGELEKISTSGNFTFLYLYRGQIKISLNNEFFFLEEGDLFVVNSEKEFLISAITDVKLVVAKIF